MRCMEIDDVETAGFNFFDSMLGISTVPRLDVFVSNRC